MLITNIVLLLAGFALLIKGADVFVDASSGIAKKLRIPSVVIGLTVVAFGTSSPEAVVSITAAFAGSNSLAVGNVVGSNIFNLLLVVGLCGIIRPFRVNLNEVTRDFWISIVAATMLLALFALFKDTVPRLASAVMLALFLIYMTVLVRQALSNKAPAEAVLKDGKKKPKSMSVSVLLAVIGCGMIVFGGTLTVDNAVEIALEIGMSERIVGITIVAIGTSLPELVTSIVAGRKGESGIALGNVVGSNIFNILFILGLAGVITPIAADPAMLMDMLVLIICSIVAFLLVISGKRVSRPEGAVMVTLYAAYTAYLVMS